MIAGGMILFLAGSLLCAVAETAYAIILGRALQGAGAVAGVVMALLSDVTREQNRTRAMAAIGGSIGLAFIVAMITGPLVAQHWGMEGVFWLTSVLAGLGLLVVLVAVPNPLVRHSGHEVVPVPAMLGRVLRDGQLWRLNVGIFSLHFAQMATWVSVPVVLEQVLDFDRSRHWSLYLSTMVAGFVLMLPFIWYGETRRKMKPVFLFAVSLLAVAELVMAGTGTALRQMVFGLVLFFMAFNLLEASLPSLVSKMAPAGIKGTAMGVYSTSQFLGAFSGGVAGGVVAHFAGFAGVFWLSLAVVLVWLGMASTMDRPRNLRSVVVDLNSGAAVDSHRWVEHFSGVEDVVVIPGENLAYVKVDDEHFNEQAFHQSLVK